MKDNGWTKSYRKELISDIWKMPPVYHRIWYWLRQQAAWDFEEISTRGPYMIAVAPGQLITGLDHIARGVAWHPWGVEKVPNRKTILNVLIWLEENSMIYRESNKRGTFISINNWGLYQAIDTEYNKGSNKTETNIRTKKGTQLKKNKEELKKSKKDIYIEEVFESLWMKYPKKDGKKAALNHFKATITTGEDINRIQKALDNYLRYLSINKIESKYIKNGSTWFNNWLDWVKWEIKGETNCSSFKKNGLAEKAERISQAAFGG